LEGETAQAAFLRLAAEHDIEPLLRRSFKVHGTWSTVPPGIRAALDDRARRESALEAVRYRETKRILCALQAAWVPTLVLKGAALAYTHYPAPYLRPRLDTDLLIEKDNRGMAVRALLGLGYARVDSVSRDSVHTQWMFSRLEGVFQHTIDLHWAISNRPFFAGILPFGELRSLAKPIDRLGPGSLAPAPVHALLLACIHRVAHHDSSNNLLWLHDIALLAERLSPREWDAFIELAVRKRVAALCRDSLALAERYVGCPSTMARQKLTLRLAMGRTESAAAYLGETGTSWRGLLLDLKGSAGIAAKVRFLAGHAFPTAEYMSKKYGTSGRIGLAAAYLRRGVGGLSRLRRRPIVPEQFHPR
jgi:hypothetical protein